MKNIRFIFAFIPFLALVGQDAHAYFAMTMPSATPDLHRRTHVVVAGYGNDLGTAPQVAATAKVRKIAEIYPNDQILFLCAKELPEVENIRFLKHLGYANIRVAEKFLTLQNLMDELAAYDQIASLHVYSHSGITPGIFLDLDPSKPSATNDIKWAYNSPLDSLLVGHFTSDAVVMLNGCNTADAQAPYLSKIWGVPVSGALTSTHFEALFKDGSYYWDDPGQAANLAKTTMSSMIAPVSCQDGACYRMRPDNWDYTGVYGHYHLGLPNYKFFCVGLTDEQCTGNMALSILTDVSTQALPPVPTLEQYAQTVQEWICPTASYGSPAQSRCMAELAKIDISHLSILSADTTYTPFGGHTAKCTFDSCFIDSECLHPDLKICALSPQASLVGSTTFVDEYLAYIRGYDVVFKARSAAH